MFFIKILIIPSEPQTNNYKIYIKKAAGFFLPLYLFNGFGMIYYPCINC